MAVYHVINREHTRERHAVVVEGDMVTITTINGEALLANELGAVLAAALGTGYVEQAAREHAARRLPWTITVREGTSGCVTYHLRELISAETINAPIIARLHVSMYEKLNEGVGPISLSNLYALMEAAGIAFLPHGENPFFAVNPPCTLEQFESVENGELIYNEHGTGAYINAEGTVTIAEIHNGYVYRRIPYYVILEAATIENVIEVCGGEHLVDSFFARRLVEEIKRYLGIE